MTERQPIDKHGLYLSVSSAALWGVIHFDPRIESVAIVATVMTLTVLFRICITEPKRENN